jgi:hypothetical protein
VSNNPEYGRNGMLDIRALVNPPTSVLFTLSIVTAQATEGQKAIVVFGNGLPLPGDWQYNPGVEREQGHGSRSGFGREQELDRVKWLEQDPRLREVFDEEMMRTFTIANGQGDTLEERFKHWNWREKGHHVVQVGMCDVRYPGFEEARIALIRHPDGPDARDGFFP